MPISGQGWEMLIVRKSEQRRSTDGRVRTVGRYQVYHNGRAQSGSGMTGATAESRGPGANRPQGNGRRIEEGRYPLFTQDGEHYVTLGYKNSESLSAEPKPGILVGSTDQRVGILIHPGKDAFLSSVGCINPCSSLSDASELIDYTPSRRRVIALIEDMKDFLAGAFPSANGKRIPRAYIVIDGEP